MVCAPVYSVPPRGCFASAIQSVAGSPAGIVPTTHPPLRLDMQRVGTRCIPVAPHLDVPSAGLRFRLRDAEVGAGTTVVVRPPESSTPVQPPDGIGAPRSLHPQQQPVCTRKLEAEGIYIAARFETPCCGGRYPDVPSTSAQWF